MVCAAVPSSGGVVLRREQMTYKRTSRNLKHKQHPDQVATKQTELEALQKRGTPGRSTWSPKMKWALP